MILVLNRILIVVFCPFLFFSYVSGQDSLKNKTHYFVFQSGFSKHIVQEDIISPLIYRGKQSPLFLNYQSRSSKSYESLSVFYDYLKLTSRITTDIPIPSFYTNNHNAQIEYTYYRRALFIPENNIDILTGGSLKWNLNLRDHYYSGNTNYTTGELTTTLGVSVFIIKEFTHRDDYLTLRVHMSILAYDALNYLYNANAPKEFYSTEADKNSSYNLMALNRPVTINKYFEIETELTYAKFFNKHLGIEFRYCFQYYKTEKVEKIFYVRSLTSQFLVGVVVKI